VGPANLLSPLSPAVTTFISARLILHIQASMSFTSLTPFSEFLIVVLPFHVYDRLPRLGFVQLSQYQTNVAGHAET